MPEQTTGGRISIWGIVGSLAFVALVIVMISHDLQKELYLLMTTVLSVFLLMVGFNVGVETNIAETAVLAEPMPMPIPSPESKSIDQPVAKKINKAPKKRR